MAISLEIFWLRSLSFVIVFKYIGPNLVAIGKMVASDRLEQCRVNLAMPFSDQSVVFFPLHHIRRHVRLWSGVTRDGLLSEQRVI
jgi:hypothetical protein